MEVVRGIVTVAIFGLFLYGGYRSVFGYDEREQLGGIGLMVFVGIAIGANLPTQLFNLIGYVLSQLSQ